MSVIRDEWTPGQVARDAAGEDLGFQVSRLSKLMRAAVAEELEPMGLTATQAAVLLNMEPGEGVPIGDVAERLGADRPTMSGVAERLARDCWITIGPNPEDGRSRLLSLTERAAEAQPALAAASARVSERALAGLAARDAIALMRALDQAAVNLTDNG